MSEVKFTSEIECRYIRGIGNDSSIVQAARVSTEGSDAIAKDSEKLIAYLMKNRHGSPFEHASMTFLVTAPIFVWREHHRHRIGFSYNEESGRYKELEPNFYIPDVARIQTGKPGHYLIEGSNNPGLTIDMANTIHNSCANSYRDYQFMIHVGIAREVARMVLPVNIMSSCFVTCNPRSLMNFLSLRVDDKDSMFKTKPQKEIQMVAEAYENVFKQLFPLTHKAFVEFGRVAP